MHLGEVTGVQIDGTYATAGKVPRRFQFLLADGVSAKKMFCSNIVATALYVLIMPVMLTLASPLKVRQSCKRSRPSKVAVLRNAYIDGLQPE